MTFASRIGDGFAAVATALNARSGLVGASAYDVAVINGYTGTQAQWLASLAAPVGETAWTTLPLYNSYVATTDGNYAVPAYRKDGDGYVTLRGLCTSPANAAAYQLFATLPAGYRPLKHTLFVILNPEIPGALQVGSDGGVMWRTGKVSATIALDGVRFLAEL